MGKDYQTSQLRLLLLGSPRFELDTTPLEISRRKAAALLVYMAVTGDVYRRETLATLLWPDHDESKAHAYLRRTLWSLKKALGDEWLVVEREQIGLVQNEGVWLDVAQFRQLLSETQAHDHPADEVCADCLPLLTEAAGLYRGDFLAGFTLPDVPGFDEWQFFQAESLRQELASVLERLVKGHSAHGDFEIAIPHARRWLNLDSLHEPAHQQLMQLYAWSGQQAAALRQYRECVRIFDEEFGVPPSEETTALDDAIKAKQFSPPSGTKQLMDVAESPATEAQETIGNQKLSAQPPRGKIQNRHNLPLQPTPFIGRTKALAEIGRLIRAEADCRLLTIVGPGGMGKTRLSIQAATGSLDTFPDGVYFVPLAPISSAEFLISAITDALNLTVYGATDPKTQVLNYLLEKATLLVLDNFEHLLTGTEEELMRVNLLSEIVLEAPRVQLLVTSRDMPDYQA